MARALNPNLEILELAIDGLGPIVDRLVFLGGCATGLLLTDLAAPTVRPSRDVDAITEVASLGDYYSLCDDLRAREFQEDHSIDAPFCRWAGHGILLDIMPTDPTVLGSGNEWYAPALACAQDYALPSKRIIRLVSAPYFIATKLAAFESRGDGDFVMSHDLEDIISVVDGRPELVGEVDSSDDAVKIYINGHFEAMLANTRFTDALPGHLPGDAASQARLPELLRRLIGLASGPAT